MVFFSHSKGCCSKGKPQTTTHEPLSERSLWSNTALHALQMHYRVTLLAEVLAAFIYKTFHLNPSAIFPPAIIYINLSLSLMFQSKSRAYRLWAEDKDLLSRVGERKLKLHQFVSWLCPSIPFPLLDLGLPYLQSKTLLTSIRIPQATSIQAISEYLQNGREQAFGSIAHLHICSSIVLLPSNAHNATKRNLKIGFSPPTRPLGREEPSPTALLYPSNAQCIRYRYHDERIYCYILFLFMIDAAQ
jgi:hypothetical protein